MTKEQEKAIYRLNLGKNIPISSECCIVNVKDIETVLSMLEEKEKIIDLMTEYIEDELTVDEFCTKEGCYADNYIDGHCEKCLNCIKQYFENKAKETEDYK